MHSRTKKTLVILFVVMVIAVLSAPAAHAFTGPGTLSPGSGGGKFAEDQSGNIGFNTQNTVGGTTHATPPYGNFSNVFMIAATSSPPGIALRNIGSDCGTEGCSSQPLYPSTYVWRLTPWGFLELINATDSSSYNAGPVMTFMGGSSYNRRIVVGNFYNATTSMDAALNVVGNVKSTGAFVGALSGGLAAGNVTGPASFGSNYGTYNFAFPGAVAIGTSTTTGLSSSGLYVGGSVGVGVVSPDARIHIQDAASATLKLQKTGSTASVIYDNSQLNIDSGGGQVWFADPIYMDEKTIYGDSIAGTNLTLESTSNSSKGYVILQPSGGNVGIGTTTPAYKLDVVGTGRFSGAVSVPTPSGDADATNKAYVDSVVGGGSGAGSFNTLSVSGTSTLAVTSGNVGIGTTNPGYKLHAYDATADIGINVETDKVNGQAYINFLNDARRWAIGVGTLDELFFYDATGTQTPFTIEAGASVNSLYVNSSGNIGIGTTSPGAKLHVLGVAAAPPTSGSTGTDIFRIVNGGGDGLAFGSYPNSPFGSWIQSNYLSDWSAYHYPLVLQPLGGNVGIGTTGPVELLHLGSHTGNATPRVAIKLDNSGYGAPAAWHTNSNGDKLILWDNNVDAETRIGFGGTSGLWIKVMGSTFANAFEVWGELGAGTLEQQFTIQKEGNVGIGTSTPAYKLDVVGTGRFTGTVVVATPTDSTHAATRG